ncbi:DUF1499 domain-containing protein [Vibrio sinaloensis]|uniref:DUF1499 domain-containing protein n=1 Tax=Photobacterium sp. (strain ATCC 43367) TaxID=379097 RepID=UPI00206CA75E|nr:DUF1499 domain-containing protein [Vibrio sinaloensis]UPQ88435.1 DUF1499 domain-containing protein [Vibrio sinaloensis]
MNKALLLAFSLITLTACSRGVTTMTDRTAAPCGDKPNCVSTQDQREKFALAPFSLTPQANIESIEQVALQLPGAKTAVKQDDYLRIECTSKIMRFVDDLELRIEGDTLLVRSESRVGYSDFGVNRKRADQLRVLLSDNGLIE